MTSSVMANQAAVSSALADYGTPWDAPPHGVPQEISSWTAHVILVKAFHNLDPVSSYTAVSTVHTHGR